MLSAQIVNNAVQAQRQGFDAVAISCFFDPGLREARSLVDIPVVSLCETALFIATTVGGRFGLIGLGPDQVFALDDLAARYGATDRIAAVLPLDPPVTETDLESMHGGGGDLEDRVEEVARRAVAQGADLIIPAEGVLNTALVRRGIRTLAGVPVMDAYGTLLSYAEMLVRLPPFNRDDGQPPRLLRRPDTYRHRPLLCRDGASSDAGLRRRMGARC